jgi:hypothetical protein
MILKSCREEEARWRTRGGTATGTRGEVLAVAIRTCANQTVSNDYMEIASLAMTGSYVLSGGVRHG